MNLAPSFRSPTSRTRKSDVRRESAKRLPMSRGLIVTAFVSVVFLAFSFGYRGPAESRKLIADLIEFGVATAASIWSLWGLWASRRAPHTRRNALAANLLSLSVVGYAGGMGLYDYYDLVLHQNPFPSWADASYVAGTLFMVAAIIALPSRRIPWVVRLRTLLDGFIVAAALVTFSWYFTLGPTILAGGDTLLGRILGPAYPVADIVMMVGLLTRTGAVDDPRAKRIRKLVAIGVVSYVVADSGYAYETLRGTYETGRWYDLGWMVTNLLVAQAAVAQRKFAVASGEESKHDEVDVRQTSLVRMLLPYLFVPGVVGLVAFVYGTAARGPLATGVYVGAAVLLALILFRQVLAIVENNRLYRYLQQAYRELEALATTDAMTGLWNHRVMQEKLRAELDKYEEAGEPLTLLLIDVDRFKAFNDQFGHPAGDGALRRVADVIRRCIRTTDIPARYGGEEFAAILPNTSAEDAVIVAERIRRTCEETAFDHRQVTLSIGVAEHLGGTAGDLIEAADRALYAAKHSGRNQTVRAGRAERLRLVQGGESSQDASPEAA